MTEQSDRLQLAIKHAGIPMQEMCERWGWSYNTLKSNANGNMPFSYRKAQSYAGRLKVRAEWLYSGELPMKAGPAPDRRAPIDVPVIGWVQAGRLSDIGQLVEIEDAEKITVGGLPSGKWFATDVIGDSMDRVSPEGSRIVVNGDDRHLIAGKYYLFSLRGETTYKRYYDRPARLEPFSTNPSNRTIFLDEKGWQVVGRVKRSFLDLD